MRKHHIIIQLNFPTDDTLNSECVVSEEIVLFCCHFLVRKLATS